MILALMLLWTFSIILARLAAVVFVASKKPTLTTLLLISSIKLVTAMLAYFSLSNLPWMLFGLKKSELSNFAYILLTSPAL